MPTQARLARILADTSGPKSAMGDVRLVAASDRDLKGLVMNGSFREDLYYRLNVVTITVPPLRERMSDVPDLARAFLARATKDGLGEKALDKSGAEELETWSWPGNVRELENVMRRIAALSPDPVIGADTIRRELFRERSQPIVTGHVGQDDDLETVARTAISKLIAQASATGKSMTDLHESVIAAVERPLFELTLRETRGNQIKAADILGLNRNTLRKRLALLDIDVGRGKA
jgi:two-component system nitrogen regulation response regulator GlnG